MFLPEKWQNAIHTKVLNASESTIYHRMKKKLKSEKVWHFGPPYFSERNKKDCISIVTSLFSRQEWPDSQEYLSFMTNRLVGRDFANGPGDLGSIPGRVILKTKKWYLIPPCLTLSIIRYVSSVKWSNPGKGVAPSSKLCCCSYWKGSLLVALDYSRQVYFFYFMTQRGGWKFDVKGLWIDKDEFPQPSPRVELHERKNIRVVWISETKLDDFYHLGFLDYGLHLYYYFPNILVDMSFGLLQVFVKLSNLHGTSN